MYNSQLENKLIFPDIADIMGDYVSIQIDIDPKKIKAACLIAQSIDVKRLVGKEVMDRLIDQDDSTSDADKKLKELLAAPLSYYTYARCLSMFQGSFTDSGFVIEDEGESKNIAKSVAAEHKSVAETLMEEVLDLLEEEEPGEQFDKTKLVPSIRVFGGKETFASN